jgi:transcriptional antiterminator
MLQNETLPQDELAQRLSVSTRTVRADITALNALLTQYGAQFILSRGNGYQLKIDDPALSPCKRSSPTRCCASPNQPGADTLSGGAFSDVGFSLKLEDLADEWFVSRATLQNDMAEVREHLQRYHLTLETRPATA